MDLLEEMQNGVVPGDGAMGTLLLEAGIPIEQCFEELCVGQPELIGTIHEHYLSAGARMIRTNSFGANAVRLDHYGLADHVNEINWSAAQLARQAAKGRDVCVAGSVGPLGISAAEAAAQGIDREDAFREQIGALLDGGAQAVMLETFTDLDELALALYVKQSLHHCPVVCSLACSEDGVLPSGMTATDAFARLRALDADIVGLNCVNGPHAMAALFEKMPVDGPTAAFPNAGRPRQHDGQLLYYTTPEDFAECARKLAGHGARLIGGCCGLGPEHIAAMVRAFDEP